MNSFSSKRYRAAHSEQNVKGDCKVFDLSNGQFIFAGDESWSATVAHGFNHHYCLPNKQLKYFVMNFIAVFDLLSQNNNAWYNMHTRTLNPESGYMVTIPGFGRMIDVPLTLNKFQDEVIAYCVNREMWDKISSDPDNIYLEFWLRDGKLYIDLTEKIANEREAVMTGHARYQIGIYDCLNKVDIKLNTESTDMI